MLKAVSYTATMKEFVWETRYWDPGKKPLTEPSASNGVVDYLEISRRRKEETCRMENKNN